MPENRSEDGLHRPAPERPVRTRGVAGFTLIGWALYLQVDKSMALLPEAEAEARYSVLESAVNRHSDVEHWGRIKTS